jgi:hypothetical protein
MPYKRLSRFPIHFPVIKIWRRSDNAVGDPSLPCAALLEWFPTGYSETDDRGYSIAERVNAGVQDGRLCNYSANRVQPRSAPGAPSRPQCHRKGSCNTLCFFNLQGSWRRRGDSRTAERAWRRQVGGEYHILSLRSVFSRFRAFRYQLAWYQSIHGRFRGGAYSWR